MEGRIPARLAAEEGRKFGRTVGIAFGLLGGILFWREHMLPAQVAWGISAFLIVGAYVAPARLKPIERAWMAMALMISKVTTPIVMGIVYFLVLTPIGVVVRRVRGNPLVHSEDGHGYWIARDDAATEKTDMRRQF